MSLNTLTNDALKISGEFTEAVLTDTGASAPETEKRGEIEKATQDNAVTSALNFSRSNLSLLN